MDLSERERRIREAVLGYPIEVRRWLLEVLASPPAERAEAIRQCWEREETRTTAELLIDLEEDRGIALEVMGVLKESVARG